MGERITRLTMRAFRAVPGELTIDLTNGASIVILGDNGTGKSSVTDALEFFFTGQVQPLAREGRGIVHHVGSQRDDTAVEVDTTSELNGIATLDQGSTDAHALAGRETFILRGRTLAEFIDKTKGEKWRSLFEILGLGQVDQVRLDLQQARNALESELTSARTQRDAAARALRDLGHEPTEESLLGAIGTSAERAGVAPPQSLDAAFSQDWAAQVGERANVVQRSAHVGLLAKNLAAAPPFPADAFVKAWNGVINSLKGVDLSRVRLVEVADDLLEKTGAVDSCPLCGQSVHDRELREHLKAILLETAKWSQAIENAARRLSQFAETLASCWQQRTALRNQVRGLAVQVPELPPSPSDQLRVSLDRRTQVDVNVLAESSQRLSDWDSAAVKLTLEGLPTVKPEDEALVKFLELVQLGKRWFASEAVFAKAERAVRIAERLHDGYLGHQSAYFQDVLDLTSGRVAAIYERLHPGERISNVAVETWGDKGVELALDFHGQRHRPPHAVLSESHLNSLGIALFLAMAETFNENLGFLILDDVVNSVDIDHRGHLAELLAGEFQGWQLIVLTHDHIFYEHLRRRAPQWHTMEISSWSFEEGPRLLGYDTGGLLEKARDRLESGDFQGAATKARRALEEILQEACEGMGASLPFRRGLHNDRREAQELIMGSRRGLKEHKALSPELANLLAALEADLQAALNVESHASTSWASQEEVKACLERLEELDAQWTCPTCTTKVWAAGQPGNSRCRCGHASFPQ